VLVVQNAKGGKEVGEVELLFGSNGKIAAKNWRKLRVDSRLDSHADPGLSAMLMPYRLKVDSVASTVTAPIDGDFSPTEMLNFASDYVMERGRRIVGNKRIDLSIMNKGGIRRNFTGKELTVGEIISTFPFENRVVVLEIKGSDLSAVFDIMARQKGNGISHNAKATFKPDFSGCEKVEINGRPIDPNRTYRVATIDYLAGGGDNMTPLKNGRIIAESPVILYRDMLDHLSGNKTLLKRDPNPRFSN
ncbi:MAG: 5'-nucleotidase C-terminal domain-containing protein, partial [Paramuribaculum sp.]|nr:5'-nucleotidase C-terminal domain-containing protein [Paramuribaculum sp.]